MHKKLAELTLEELWRLFPISLTEHQTCWADWYREEEALLRRVLPLGEIRRICWIGSTSIDTIWAKPIIDILVEQAADGDPAPVKAILLENGYTCMSEDENRISFNKGYTETGFAQKVYHLHLRRAGDHDELYFRDYLREHHDTAAEYERLKLSLWKQFEFDRDGYTRSKTDFIAACTRRAKEWYEGRYEDL